MGGCRCSFQDCDNSTARNPGMHFFRYPVKYPQRLAKWIENADRPEFTDMPEAKLKNKVVCQKHFEAQYFMNKNQDSLTKVAIPTLRNNWEPEEVEKLVSKELEPSKIAQDILDDFEISVVDENPPPKKMKINIQSIENPLNESQEIVCRFKKKASNQIQDPLAPATVLFPESTTDTEPQSPGEDFYLQATQSLKDIRKIIVENIQVESQSKENLQDIRKIVQDIKDTNSDSQSKEHLEDIRNIVKDIKETVTELKDRTTTRAESQQHKTETVVVSTGPKMDKRNLFKAIKRQINPTMAVLLGMELFGSADHEWQEEERDLAISLLSQGKPIYEYFRDELRFRLPSIADVEAWMQQEQDH